MEIIRTNPFFYHTICSVQLLSKHITLELLTLDLRKVDIDGKDVVFCAQLESRRNDDNDLEYVYKILKNIM